MTRAAAMRGWPALLAAACLGVAAPAPAHADRDAASTRDLYLLLIRQARIDGRPRAALAYLADFDRRHPDDLEARILRINCLLDLGQIKAAEAAVAQLPPSSADGAANAIRGHVLAARGDWAQAIPQYRAALAASPTNPLTRNALGYAQLRAGDAAPAVETLKAAAALAPTNKVIRNNLLLALTLAGRKAEADAAILAMADPAARATLRRQLAGEARRLSAAHNTEERR